MDARLDSDSQGFLEVRKAELVRQVRHVRDEGVREVNRLVVLELLLPVAHVEDTLAVDRVVKVVFLVEAARAIGKCGVKQLEMVRGADAEDTIVALNTVQLRKLG
jgi:hypothetical protein